MSAPRLHLVVELEEPPRVFVDCVSEGEWLRLFTWLEKHPALGGVLDVLRELEGEERAA
jgi:hypothetical protein